MVGVTMRRRARSSRSRAVSCLTTREIFNITGLIDRREGRWDDAVKNLEKAAELDPRNPRILGDLAVLYDLLRRYDEEQAVFDRAAAANPANATYFQMMRASIELEKGNLETARAGLDALPAGYDPDGAVTFNRITLALYERDPAAAEKILTGSNLEEIVGGTGSILPRSWFEALIARAQGNAEKRGKLSRWRAKRQRPSSATIRTMEFWSPSLGSSTPDCSANQRRSRKACARSSCDRSRVMPWTVRRSFPMWR